MSSYEAAFYHFQINNDPLTGFFTKSPPSNSNLTSNFFNTLFSDCVNAVMGLGAIPLGVLFQFFVLGEFVWSRFDDPERTGWAYTHAMEDFYG